MWYFIGDKCIYNNMPMIFVNIPHLSQVDRTLDIVGSDIDQDGSWSIISTTICDVTSYKYVSITFVCNIHYSVTGNVGWDTDQDGSRSIYNYM